MLTSCEQVLDDFIFLSLLVGNDFLPHLPSLHIHEGAMDDLLEMYASSILTGVCSACVCSPFVFFSCFVLSSNPWVLFGTGMWRYARRWMSRGCALSPSPSQFPQPSSHCRQ